MPPTGKRTVQSDPSEDSPPPKKKLRSHDHSDAAKYVPERPGPYLKPLQERTFHEGTPSEASTSTPTAAASAIQNLILQEISNPEDTYVYTPFLPGEDLRILVILPGKKDDAVECRLVPGLLPSTENRAKCAEKIYRYAALSYFGGSPRPLHKIKVTTYATPMTELSKEQKVLQKTAFKLTKRQWVESGYLHVRSNLLTALRRFRNKRDPVHLWIDAICINQANKEEKALQVARMHEIYSCANDLCIWLGDGTESKSHPRSTFKFLRAILDLDSLDSLCVDESIIHKWKLVVDLMWNKWFGQRWVVQELALAPSATVFFGRQAIDWQDFADAIALFVKNYDKVKPQLQHNAEKTSGSLSDVQSLEDMKFSCAYTLVDANNNLFRKSRKGNKLQLFLSLEGVVSELLTFEATDPRDTIFAVLSIARDTFPPEPSALRRNILESSKARNEIDPRVRPDYQKSLFDVCADFMEYCVEKSKSLDILCRHWAPRNPQLTGQDAFTGPEAFELLKKGPVKDLPSWISSVEKAAFGGPKYLHGRRNGDSLVGKLSRQNQRNFSASLELVPNAKFSKAKRRNAAPQKKGEEEVREDKYDGRLYVKGIRIGNIKTLAECAVEGMIFKEAFEMSGFDYTWSQSNGGWSPQDPRVPDEFWRTLVADHGPDMTSAPAWYPRACLECLKQLSPSGDLNTGAILRLGRVSSTLKSFLERVQKVIWNRRLMKLNDGKEKLLGLAPAEAEKRDIVCIFFGCSVPVVLRPVKGESFFQLIGECYVHGIMDGERVDSGWEYPYEDKEMFELR